MGWARRSRWSKRRWRGVAWVCGVGAVALVGWWGVVWPYVVGVVGVAVLGLAGWGLWRVDRRVRERHREWARQDAVRAGHRSLAEVDGMSGEAFEDLVASLCRRDGCREVRRVGGSGDNGADVRGVLPDGRTMVVQCKRYAPSRAIPARDIRDLAGSRGYFRAEVAVFVTTSRFTEQALAFAAAERIVTVHRDLLGLWHQGTPLGELSALGAAGQGDRRHRARWRAAYGGAPYRAGSRNRARRAR